MWKTEYSITTKAAKEKIWRLWADVENWKLWDNSVEYSTINGIFDNETTGVLKPKNGPKSKFVLKNCVELKSFTTRSSLPFGKMDFEHLILEQNNELEIIHRVEMRGLLTFLFSKVIGKNIEKSLPEAVNKLVELAEKM